MHGLSIIICRPLNQKSWFYTITEFRTSEDSNDYTDNELVHDRFSPIIKDFVKGKYCKNYNDVNSKIIFNPLSKRNKINKIHVEKWNSPDDVKIVINTKNDYKSPTLMVSKYNQLSDKPKLSSLKYSTFDGRKNTYSSKSGCDLYCYLDHTKHYGWFGTINSAKQKRRNNFIDVIWNSSSRKNPLKYCLLSF